MRSFLIFLGAAGLVGQVIIGLSYLVSSIWEKEQRAAVFGGLQLLAILIPLILYFYLFSVGFFHSPPGIISLILGLIIGAGAVLALIIPLGVNAEALESTRGLIVGDVRRQDEREIMFARNCSLLPDSDQYHKFYTAHPEYETYDNARRAKGGTLGRPGSVDKPHERPNVAATFASFSIPKDEPAEVNGTLRWKLNAETCFDYWGSVGTDCNICMRVCPWSHANTFPHKIIRELISRNRYSRK